MTYENSGAGALDYLSCGYGQGRLRFRGPERSLRKPYSVFIGGTETYGKFVARPFASLVEDRTNLTSVNLGVINAGIETMRADSTVLRIARKAEFVVLQVMPPQYISNSYYSVHPRRNDRFIRANPALQRLYPDIDFTEFHFVGHLLSKLRRRSARAFDQVVLEVRKVWLTSLIGLIRGIARPTLVLWLPSGDGAEGNMTDVFLTDRVLNPIRKRCAGLVTVVPNSHVTRAGTEGMVFGSMEAFAAAGLPNPGMHQLIADHLGDALQELSLF